MSYKGNIVCLGAATALLLGGTVAPMPTQVTPAYAAGAEFVADQSGDSGPGTLADAIEQANAAPGADTVLVRGALTLSQTIAVTESVTIQGEGAAASSLTFTHPTGGSMLVADAGSTTISLAGLAITGNGETGVAPLVDITETDPALSTALSELTITSAGMGFLRIGASASAIELRGVDASASRYRAAPEAPSVERSRSATVAVSALTASLTVADSTFHDDNLAAIFLTGVDLANDELVTISNSKFSKLSTPDQEAAALSLGGALGQTRDMSALGLSITGSSFDSVSGTYAMIEYSGFRGRAEVQRSTFENSGGEFAAHTVVSSVLQSSVSYGGTRITDSMFRNNEYAVYNAINGTAGGGPALVLENSIIENDSESVYGQVGGIRMTLTGREEISEPVLQIKNSSISGTRGSLQGGVYLDYRINPSLVSTEHLVLIDGSTFFNNVGSSFSNDVWLRLTAGYEAGTLVRNSTFVGGGDPAEGNDNIAIMPLTSSTPLTLDHVTMKNSAIQFASSSGSSALTTVRNSVIESPEGVPGVGSRSSSLPPVTVEHSALSDPGAIPDVEAVSAGDIALGELQDNGGPTKTVLPGHDSVLIDAGGDSDLTVDQRGSNRVVGLGSDIGAVEVDGGTLEMGADVEVSAGESLGFVVTRAGAAELPVSATVTLMPGTAKPGTDYTEPTEPITVSWAAGETGQKTVAVPTLESVAGERQLTATLEGPLRGADIGDRVTATGTIIQEEVTVPPETGVTPPGEDVPSSPNDTQGDRPLPETGATRGGWLALGALALVAAGAALTLRRIKRRS